LFVWVLSTSSSSETNQAIWTQTGLQFRLAELICAKSVATITQHQTLLRLPAISAKNMSGNYKQSEYGKVVLPFTVLRRLDCVLEPTKQAVLDQQASLSDGIGDTLRETMSRSRPRGLRFKLRCGLACRKAAANQISI